MYCYGYSDVLIRYKNLELFISRIFQNSDNQIFRNSSIPTFGILRFLHSRILTFRNCDILKIRSSWIPKLRNIEIPTLRSFEVSILRNSKNQTMTCIQKFRTPLFITPWLMNKTWLKVWLVDFVRTEKQFTSTYRWVS